MDHSKTFSNTDYLGAGEHPDFIKYLSEGMQKYGVHFAGSRLSNTCPDIYDQLEEFVVRKFDAPASVLGASGSFMGALVLAYCRTFDQVFCQEDIHPALNNSLLRISRFEDADDLLAMLSNCPYEEVVVLANSVNPINLKVFDMEKIKTVPPNKKIQLIIDDSHGIGITGRDGLGIFGEAKKMPDHISLSVLASLGKAYSVPGGIIMGDREMISHIRDLPQWGGASPVPPAYAFAFMQMQSVYDSNFHKLRENTDLFLQHVDRKLIHYIDHFPVFILKPPKMFTFLLQFGYTISSFGYPSKDSRRVERIVMNSAKKKIDILKLAEYVNLVTSLA